MDDEDVYAVGSSSAASGALHFWLRKDVSSRRNQTNCRPCGPGAVARVAHNGHLFVASASSSGSSSHICAHSLARVSGGPSSRSAAPEPSITAVDVAPASALLAGAGSSGRCYIWSLASGDLLASWDAHFRAVSRIFFSDDEETLITAGADASVLAFDVAELVDLSRPPGDIVEPRVALRGHELPVVALAVGFGGASARVVTASADRTAKFWHLSSGSCIGTVLLSAPCTDAVFSGDESAAFIGLESGTILVVPPTRLSAASPVGDASLERLTVPVHEGKAQPAVTALATSPCGTEVIAGFGDGCVRIFNVHSRAQLVVYAKHGDVPITWVGVFYPVPDALTRDGGGPALVMKGTETSPDASKAENGASIAGVLPPQPADLLFEGALRKAVEPQLEKAYQPRVHLAKEGRYRSAWSAVDRALELS